jgi:hypothetical protein
VRELSSGSATTLKVQLFIDAVSYDIESVLSTEMSGRGMTSSAIVQKLWNYCNVLRNDGMSYGDYVEQLTYLLFLKMADERTKPPHNQPSSVPAEYSWPTLMKKDGDELFDHYRHVLEKLGNEKGLLGLIFNKSQNKFQDPAKLRRLIVDLIDKENFSPRRSSKTSKPPSNNSRNRERLGVTRDKKGNAIAGRQVLQKCNSSSSAGNVQKLHIVLSHKPRYEAQPDASQ